MQFVRFLLILVSMDVEQTYQFIPNQMWLFFFFLSLAAYARLFIASLVNFGSSSQCFFLFAQLHILSWFNKNRAQWWYCIVVDVSDLLLFCTLIRYSHDRYVYVKPSMWLLYSLFFVIEQVIYCTKTVKRNKQSVEGKKNLSCICVYVE